MLACCKNFGEPRKFSEPIHLSDVYLPVHATRRGKESEKQSITGYEIKNFGEPRKFGEPIHLSDVYLAVHATPYFRTGRGKESEKQSITGYEIMTSIRPSYLRSTLTERFNGYEGCIVLQNANALPLHPHRR